MMKKAMKISLIPAYLADDGWKCWRINGKEEKDEKTMCISNPISCRNYISGVFHHEKR